VAEICRTVGLEVRCFGDLRLLEETDLPARGCVILDLRLPGLGGIPAVERLRRLSPRLPVICVSAFVDARTVVRALRAGAVDFFDKPFSQNEMVEAIQLALQGSLMLPAASAAPRSDRELRRLLNTLTRRQKDVLSYFAVGAEDREIAHRLGLHRRTVQRHLRNALAVLELSRDDRDVIARLQS
jgi:FixJ family two-component response regulator